MNAEGFYWDTDQGHVMVSDLWIAAFLSCRGIRRELRFSPEGNPEWYYFDTTTAMRALRGWLANDPIPAQLYANTVREITKEIDNNKGDKPDG